MKILYFNNCWFTNVGEAFIDIGGMELVRNIFSSDCQICCMSAMSNWYTEHARYSSGIKDIVSKFISTGKSNEVADMSIMLDADYIIMPGMMGSIEYLEGPERHMIDNLVRRGCKVIFLGLGFGDYTSEERSVFSKYIENLKPALIVSRDKNVFEAMKNIAPCIDGIDCAFWTRDVFDPRGFARTEYDIVSFNRTEQPDIFSNWDVPIIYPQHMQYLYTA